MLQQPNATVTAVAKAFKVNRSTLYLAMAEGFRLSLQGGKSPAPTGRVGQVLPARGTAFTRSPW